MKNTTVVGLTGIIGSGKSVVADIFRELGAEIIDTDLIAHEITARGGIAIAQIASVLGEEFITPTCELDREKVRNLVFNNDVARISLEKILHELIYDQVVLELNKVRSLKQIQDPMRSDTTSPTNSRRGVSRQNWDLNMKEYKLVILVVPLLFKVKKFLQLVDYTLFIDCNEPTIFDRVRKRSILADEVIKKILLAQTPRETQLKLADFVIENNDSIEQLRLKVIELHSKLMQK